jgi:hypothetical protein
VRVITPVVVAAHHANLSNDPADARIESCAAAEVWGGAVHAIADLSVPEPDFARAWEAHLLPYFRQTVDRIGFDFSEDWVDAVRFALGSRDWARAKHPFQTILAQAQSTLAQRSDDYSVPAKWLRVVQPCLMEVRYSDYEGASMHRALAELLISHLDHPYARPSPHRRHRKELTRAGSQVQAVS